MNSREIDPLAQLVSDGVVEEVISRLKSGKEADVFLVQHAGEIVAAKVYKERHARSFHNNAAYREGRQVRNSRTQRAMERGSRFGRAAAEEAWKATESDALHKLYAAGVRVPQPVMFYEGVLLMEVVIDPGGHPAPRLIDAPIPKERAADLYADLRAQAVRMLTCDVIHGDLSPYNVLLAWNGPTIIDFPQVIGAAHNRQAEFFFQRDLNTLRRFFAALDPSLHARGGDAREIWRAYERRELAPDFVPEGRPAPQPTGRGHPSRSSAPRTARLGPSVEHKGRSGGATPAPPPARHGSPPGSGAHRPQGTPSPRPDSGAEARGPQGHRRRRRRRR